MMSVDKETTFMATETMPTAEIMESRAVKTTFRASRTELLEAKTL